MVREWVINDHTDPFPVLVYGDPERRAVYIYLRRAGERVLTFTREEGALRDQEAGNPWDPVQGLAVSGLLAGVALKQVLSSTAYDWA